MILSVVPGLARTRVREGSADACARPQRNNSLFSLARGFLDLVFREMLPDPTVKTRCRIRTFRSLVLVHTSPRG
jgi:hypothetical protein